MRIDLAEFYRLFDQLETQGTFMEQWLEDWQEHYVHWLIPAVRSRSTRSSICMIFAPQLCLQRSWYDRYEHILVCWRDTQDRF
jgi:ATP-dependent DNA helicase DinG